MSDGEDGVLPGVRSAPAGPVMMLPFSEVGVGTPPPLVPSSQVSVSPSERRVGVGLPGVFALSSAMMVTEGLADVPSGSAPSSAGAEPGMDPHTLKPDTRSGSERSKSPPVIPARMHVGGEPAHCLCRVRRWCQGAVYCDLPCDNSGTIRNPGRDLKAGRLQPVAISRLEFRHERKEVGVVEDNGGYAPPTARVEKPRICLASKGVSHGQRSY
jgi:hypothetical protein